MHWRHRHLRHQDRRRGLQWRALELGQRLGGGLQRCGRAAALADGCRPCRPAECCAPLHPLVAPPALLLRRHRPLLLPRDAAHRRLPGRGARGRLALRAPATHGLLDPLDPLRPAARAVGSHLPGRAHDGRSHLLRPDACAHQRAQPLHKHLPGGGHEQGTGGPRLEQPPVGPGGGVAQLPLLLQLPPLLPLQRRRPHQRRPALRRPRGSLLRRPWRHSRSSAVHGWMPVDPCRLGSHKGGAG
mmetsp:Transcript_124255/g.362747  ORF Transcript_124255/g.362747 Transcript_124255/m.362747 type:complete len:243 (+) Transcript_124255:850-1578(+)